MTLSQYFEKAKGFGVLATADAEGKVNTAIYISPLFLDKDDATACSFIMGNRLTHDNLKHNPSASYLFIEQGDRYAGKRLSLIVGQEECDNPEKIKAIRRRLDLPLGDEECKYLVHFHIEGVRPLIGNG
jgi:hypothetical protein